MVMAMRYSTEPSDSTDTNNIISPLPSPPGVTPASISFNVTQSDYYGEYETEKASDTSLIQIIVC